MRLLTLNSKSWRGLEQVALRIVYLRLKRVGGEQGSNGKGLKIRNSNRRGLGWEQDFEVKCQ